MQEYTGNRWNEIIASLPNPHILQTQQWGQFKAEFGWQPRQYVWQDEGGQACAAALVLKRAVPGGLHVLYLPRGPLVDWDNRDLTRRVLTDLQGLARRQGSIFIKLDGEIITGRGIPGTEEDRPHLPGEQMLEDMRASGWFYSPDQIQFRNTVWLDLSGPEELWLERMKQKTRYNLRLAQRRGVQVRAARVEDLPQLYRMYAETSIRDGFVIRSEDYYVKLWQKFYQQGLAEPLVAEVDGQMVSGLVLFTFAGRAWYLYGMSIQAHREKMPNYLLQWEAMRRAAQRGCTQYDLWGAPEAFNESDSMWGVFRFKEGLGGEVIRTAGAWDYTPRPWLYTLYTRILPRILDVMRRRGKARTRQEVTL